MKKPEFIDAIYNNLEGAETKTSIANVLKAIDEVTLDTIAKEDFVPFGFAKVGGQTRPARTARNPRTGEKIDVPAKSGYPYAKFTKAAKE